jgi:hypothetical protein
MTLFYGSFAILVKGEKLSSETEERGTLLGQSARFFARNGPIVRVPWATSRKVRKSLFYIIKSIPFTVPRKSLWASIHAG